MDRRLGYAEYQLKPDRLLDEERKRRLERRKLRNVKSVLKIDPPKQYSSVSKRQTSGYKPYERKLAVAKENRRLHSNLDKIYSQEAKDTFVSEMHLNTNTRIAAGLEDDQPGFIGRGKASRREQLNAEVSRQNRAFYSRLVDVKPMMRRSQWENEFAKHQKHVRHVCKLPCVPQHPDHDFNASYHSIEDRRDVDDTSAYGSDDEKRAGSSQRASPKFGRRSRQDHRSQLEDESTRSEEDTYGGISDYGSYSHGT